MSRLKKLGFLTKKWKEKIKEAQKEIKPSFTLEDLEYRKNILNKFSDGKYKETRHTIKIPSNYDNKRKKPPLYWNILIDTFLILISFSIFGFFYYKLTFISSLPFNTFFLIFSINLIFFSKCLQLIYFRKGIVSKKENKSKINFRILIKYTIPVIFFICFFIYIFYINYPLDLFESFNHATKEDITIILPILFIITTSLSIFKLVYFKINKDFNKILLKFKKEKPKNEFAYFWWSYKHYVLASLFFSLIISLIFTFYNYDTILTIILCIILLVPFNYLFSRLHIKISSVVDKVKNSLKKKYKNIDYNQIKLKIERKNKIEKEGEVTDNTLKLSNRFKFSITQFLILLMTILGVIFYIFDFFSFQTNVMIIFNIINMNFFVLSLLIVNFIFFLLTPIIKIISIIIVVFMRFIYNKGIKTIYFGVFFAIVLIFILKIFVFNIRILQLNETIEWLISGGISILISVISKKKRLSYIRTTFN